MFIKGILSLERGDLTSKPQDITVLTWLLLSNARRISKLMTYIVTTPCIECKYTDCAAVCPVEAFHETPDRLLINPDTCIDCDACLPECPVEAIFSDMSIPEEYLDWLEKNAEAENYPIISVKQPALMSPGCTGPPE